MATKSPELLWLAEAKKAAGAYLYIDEHGRAAYTYVPKLALRCRSESGCRAYIEEFALNEHFEPTAHYFD